MQSAQFRGRGLVASVETDLPEGIIGIVAEKKKDDELKKISDFHCLVEWHHAEQLNQGKSSDREMLARTRSWFEIAQAVHNPVP